MHSKACPNVANLLYEQERQIEVEWAGGAPPAEATYAVKLMIYTKDRPGMVRDLTSVIAEDNTNIRDIEAKGHPAEGKASIHVTIEIVDTKHLDRIVAAIRHVGGVHEIERVLRV